MKTAGTNFDPEELEKFAVMAEKWWNPKGPFRGLHDINPLREKYISDRAGIQGKAILDIGCGGGLLSEALSKRGGHVTGIDLNTPALCVAQKHAEDEGLIIHYQNISAEDFAQSHEGAFDIVACMELLEHVPDPFGIIKACKIIAKPGGHVFFSTINRTFRSYLLAIVMSEYVLKLLERNTHNPKKFIRPAQLKAWGEKAGLTFLELSGIFYFPYIPICRLSGNTDVNYMMHFRMET